MKEYGLPSFIANDWLEKVLIDWQMNCLFCYYYHISKCHFQIEKNSSILDEYKFTHNETCFFYIISFYCSGSVVFKRILSYVTFYNWCLLAQNELAMNNKIYQQEKWFWNISGSGYLIWIRKIHIVTIICNGSDVDSKHIRK